MSKLEELIEFFMLTVAYFAGLILISGFIFGLLPWLLVKLIGK